MELFIFARFHTRENMEEAAFAVLSDQVANTRKERGCVTINAFRSTRDPRQFFIHSRWRDETEFNVHAELPSTLAFIARMESLIDHPFDVHRTRPIA